MEIAKRFANSKKLYVVFNSLFILDMEELTNIYKALD